MKTIAPMLALVGKYISDDHKVVNLKAEENFRLGGIVYLSRKTQVQYLALNRHAEAGLYNKLVAVPALVPVDGFCDKSWRKLVSQIEINLNGTFSLDVLLKEKTGEKQWEIGFGLESKFSDIKVVSEWFGCALMINGITVAKSKSKNPDSRSWMLDSFGLAQEPQVLGHLMDRAKRAAELSMSKKYDLLLVHNSWIKTNDPLRFNMFISERVGKNNNLSVIDVIFNRMGLDESMRKATKIRFGKDAISAAISEFHKVKLVAYNDIARESNKDALSHDGIIWVKSFPGLSVGEFGLVRGYYKTRSGRIGILKARVGVNPFIAMANPVAEALHTACIDGWSCLGQFKFTDIADGDIVDVYIGLKKDESEEGEADNFSVNQAITYVGRCDDKTIRKFRDNVAKCVAAASSEKMADSIDRSLFKVFLGESDKASVNGDMAKYLLGMSGSWKDTDNDTWVRNRLKVAYSYRSKDVPVADGERPSDPIFRVGVCVADSVSYVKIVRDETNGFIFNRVERIVSDDKMICSDTMLAKLRKYERAPITISRDPVLTATSYLDMGFDKDPIPGFTTRFVFISAQVGCDLAADGDDFIKILIGYKSLVKPGSVPAIDKHCKEIPIENLSEGALYVWGMIAQSMVGAYVNCLHRSILFGADPNTGSARVIAQACQALVQAIKKPVVPSISFDKAREIANEYEEAYNGEDRDLRSSLWTIVHKSAAVEDKVDAISDYFGKTISFDEKVKVADVHTSTVSKQFIMRLFTDTFVKGGSELPVGSLNRVLVDGLFKIHGINVEDPSTVTEETLRPVVQDYYAFFRTVYRIHTGEVVWNKDNKVELGSVISWKLGSAVKLAYGGALYWGAAYNADSKDIVKSMFADVDVDYDND